MSNRKFFIGIHHKASPEVGLSMEPGRQITRVPNGEALCIVACYQRDDLISKELYDMKTTLFETMRLYGASRSKDWRRYSDFC